MDNSEQTEPFVPMKNDKKYNNNNNNNNTTKCSEKQFLNTRATIHTTYIYVQTCRIQMTS